MVGRDVELSTLRANRVPGTALLSVRDLTLTEAKRRVLRNISLHVCAGEIVGVAGVSGNGQRELAETIAGIRTPSSGTIAVGSRHVEGKGVRKTRAAGLSFVPEDRLGTGLAPSMSIAENLLLTRPRSLFISKRKVQAEAARIIDEYEVKAPGPDAMTSLLSGGNSQKVLLARELAASGTDASTQHVLVVASPTRGLDIGATESVRRRLDERVFGRIWRPHSDRFGDGRSESDRELTA
jgi:simple sugar transport system ATP-binding protein